MRLSYRFSKILLGLVVVGGVAFLVTQAFAQQGATAKGNATGYPQDWTHHHVVFSDPGSYGDAMATGTLKEWNAITHDPRYLMQQAIRNAGAGDAAGIDESAAVKQTARTRRTRLHRDWSENMGSNATVGAGQYPAKYSFSTTSNSCSDFAVYNTGLTGTTSQASIIAYTNIYSGCSGNGAVPKIAWEYNTGGTITTSVVLSFDGTQVAFIHNPGPGVSSSLVLLKWAATGTTLTISTVSNASYRSCTAPCMTTLTFSDPNPPVPAGQSSDTYSAPFYDYAGDAMYVGDDWGYLHRFTNVFKGTPAEAGSPWPVLTNSANNNNLGSPVYDGNGNVFAADYNGDSSNPSGFLYHVTVATGAVTASAEVGYRSLPFVDAPIVDPTAGKVYLFESRDIGAGAAARAGVFQLPTNFTSGAGATTEAKIGTASTSIDVYAGAFDNAYTGTSPSGNLYVCGNPGGSPTLYQIAITTNTMSTTATSKATPGSSGATCSPVTEFFNNGTDYAFLSVTAANGSPPSGCTSGSGCVVSYNITTSSSVTVSGASTEAGGTSGIVIDNNLGSGGSQVYFSTLANQTCATSGGTGGCAIQASQSAP